MDESDEVIDHSETVASFVAITGTTSNVALHYLEACGFDVARSVDFYFQNPPDPHGARLAHDDDMDVTGPHAGHVTAVEEVGYVDDTDEDEQGGENRGRSQYPSVDHARSRGEDEELQRALAASMNESGRNPAPCTLM